MKQFKWFHDLEEIMGDRPNVGRPPCPVDSLSGPSHRDKGKQKKRKAIDDFDRELNAEEREELRIEEGKLKCRGNQPSPAEDEMGVPGSANFSPAAPSSNDDEKPTKRERKKNLRKLWKKAKARGTTKKENTAVEEANEKMDAQVKSNERIQKEKLQIEERMETKRIESRVDGEKEDRELPHKNIQAIGGIIKHIVHDITQVFQPGIVQLRGNAAPPMTFPSTSTSTPPLLNAPTPEPFSFRKFTPEPDSDLNAESHTLLSDSFFDGVAHVRPIPLIFHGFLLFLC
jgi:hypothetical protein